MSFSNAPETAALPVSGPVLVVRRIGQAGAYCFRSPDDFAKWARKRSNKTHSLRLTLGFATSDFPPAPLPRGGVHEAAIAWAYEKFLAANAKKEGSA